MKESLFKKILIIKKYLGTLFQDDNPPELLVMILATSYKKTATLVQLLLVSTLTYFFIYCAYGKLLLYSQMAQMHNTLMAFVGFVDDLLLVTSNIIGIIGITQSSSLIKVFRSILRIKTLQKKGSVTFKVYLTLLFLLPLASIIFGFCFFGRHFKWSDHKLYVPRDLCFTGVNLTVIAIASLVNKTRERFTAFNDQLEAFCKRYCSSLKPSEDVYRLKNLQNYYDTLCKLIKQLNQHTSIILTIIGTCITVEVLYNVTIIIEFGIKPKIIHGIDLKTVTILQQSSFLVTSMVKKNPSFYIFKEFEFLGSSCYWSFCG